MKYNIGVSECETASNGGKKRNANLHFGLFTDNQPEKVWHHPDETPSFDQGVKGKKGACGLWATGRKETALRD